MSIKTLKDLKKFDLWGDLNKEGELIAILHIKEEAYKWIKELETIEYGTNENYAAFADGEYSNYIQAINWIKHFFNISGDEE